MMDNLSKKEQQKQLANVNAYLLCRKMPS